MLKIITLVAGVLRMWKKFWFIIFIDVIIIGILAYATKLMGFGWDKFIDWFLISSWLFLFIFGGLGNYIQYKDCKRELEVKNGKGIATQQDYPL
jgi:hypothetical protein